MLPRVKIIFENGAIGAVAPSEDGVIGIIASGVEVVDKFALSTPYLLTKLSDLTALEITADEDDVNANIYKTVSEIYSEADEGTKVWLMAVANTVTMTEMFDVTKDYAKVLIEAANGNISILIPSKVDASEYTPTVVDGLDSDVWAAELKAQALAKWATETKFAPLFVILPGRHYTGVAANLADLSEHESNRVAILIADVVENSTDACVGLLAGRVSSIPVQRSVARVKNGAIASPVMYIADKIAENGNPDVIHDNGFITARTFVGKAGYFWSDDKLATTVSDDYALIPRRRVIDKAYRIAYQTIAEELGEEIPVTEDGKIPAAIVKSIQNNVESAIENSMTAEGNLGIDPGNQNDTGVSCYIDIDQNVVSTSKLNMNVRVKPYGYAKYIDVYIGFKTTNI